MCVATTEKKSKSESSGGRRLLALFVRNREGATAIEFAMLAFPFLLLIFAILETCISFAAQQVMSNAMDDVARDIRTGQEKAMTAEKLKTAICAKLSVVVTSARCTANLDVDLRKYTSFKEAAGDGYAIGEGEKVKIKDKNGVLSDPKVAPGGASTINSMRVFYKWPVVSDILRSYTTDPALGKSKTLLFSTVTWQNEPFNN